MPLLKLADKLLKASANLQPVFECFLANSKRPQKVVVAIIGVSGVPLDMHDFCFTLPYGALLILGGVFGFLRKGSIPSLAGGAGTGALLCLAGYIQLQHFHQGKNNLLAEIIQLAVSVILTGVLGQRYMLTYKFMPAGMITAMSGFMALFYVYKLIQGGNHIVKKVTTD